MKLSADKRQLLRDYESLGGPFKEHFQRWGLLGTLGLLDELLNLFWSLNKGLERIDAEYEQIVAELERGSELVDANFPDRATVELFSAIQVLEEVFNTVGQRRSLPMPSSGFTRRFYPWLTTPHRLEC